jgi:GNAT superfamily N-acetyltransferase
VVEAAESCEQPVVLTASHDLSLFSCGEDSLDHWLRDRALENMNLGASRTYVACPQGSKRVVAYYALAMGSILNQDVVGSMRRNMPHAIPAVILGRLAIDQEFQGRGLGAALLRDATMRSARAAAEISARLVVVHALSAEAEDFYRHHGFTRLPVDTPTLALDLVKLAKLRST